MKLRLSEDYVIDTDDYRKEGLRIAILTMSGHGKSNAAADVVEDVLDQKASDDFYREITPKIVSKCQEIGVKFFVKRELRELL